MQKLIIDTDPGIDDAAAITLAIISEKFDIRLISATAANVDVDKTTKNALKPDTRTIRSRYSSGCRTASCKISRDTAFI